MPPAKCASPLAPPRLASPPPPHRSAPKAPCPIRAASLPWASCGCSDAFALDQFACQFDIGLAAGTAQIIDQRWHAMAGRFGDAHVARDHGVIDFRTHIL